MSERFENDYENWQDELAEIARDVDELNNSHGGLEDLHTPPRKRDGCGFSKREHLAGFIYCKNGWLVTRWDMVVTQCPSCNVPEIENDEPPQGR